MVWLEAPTWQLNQQGCPVICTKLESCSGVSCDVLVCPVLNRPCGCVAWYIPWPCPSQQAWDPRPI